MQFVERLGCVLLVEGLQILLARHLGTNRPVADGHYMGDKRGDVVEHREYQHNLQRSKPRQFIQQMEQQIACRRIEADERIVHNQKPWAGKQRFGELEFP